jgi:class 3 adenylate cyclase/predicted ATPase
MDIGGWLRGLGFARYEAVFRENEIDAEVLPHLTAEDLRDLGITTVGHRRKLLAAIAALPAPALSEAVPPSSTPSAPRKANEVSAERRPITVMFCDLVGSTSLAAKLDAEDWRDLVGAYLHAASTAVERFGGHVLKKLGDGLMALFGYPLAQENDAERAARAALAILSALEALNAKNAGRDLPALAARIGLESGPVVVDGTGEVFGEAPNVAARVQGAAEPGTVLVTASVQRQIAGLFVVEDKGAHALKGVPAAVALYRIMRPSGGGRRGGARSLTPLVGREEDLALLMRRWERARSGEGQFVQIVGEPGLGKSRLMDEFHTRIGATPHTWVEWSSSQLLQNTPLHPVAEWGHLRFGGADVAPDKRLAELEAALAQVKLDSLEQAPLLAPVLDIPLPESRAAKLVPEELRLRQLAALATWVLAGARTQPIVLAFEDLHWADPTSLDLLKTLAERSAVAPLFILATARPEFRAPWATRSHHGVISLVPLDRGEIRRMVGAIAERHALARESVEDVADRTGGVPLFVEEVTRLLLEGGAQTIPPTLQQSLAARLDRLGDAREVAQIGAVLGREFSYGLLRSVAGVAPAAAVADRGVGGRSEAALQSALDRLFEADLLFVEGIGPEGTYRFKHALIQDAAYESLLKSRRQALHRRAAEALLAAPDHEPELVAHHFTRAGETDLAIEWWGKAGDAALRRSAFQEAIAHLGKAIEIADTKGEATRPLGRADKDGRLSLKKVNENYARAVMLGRGYSAPETSAALARARGASSTPHNFENAFAEWARHFIGGDLSSAEELGQHFIREARSEQLAAEHSVGLRLRGMARLFRGQFATAHADLELALSTCVDDPELYARIRLAADHQAMVRVSLAIANWYIGNFKAACDLARAAETAAASGDPPTNATVLVWCGFLNGLRRRPESARANADTAVALGREYGMPVYSAYGSVLSGWARACLGITPKPLEAFRGAIRELIESGMRHGVPVLQGLLAELELKDGGLRESSATVDAALSMSRESGRASDDSFLHRLRGDILLKSEPSNLAPAEEAYRTAIAVAEEQGARTYEFLASLALAKLYQSTGRPLDAQAVLAPALEGLAPTPEMPEIAEAQALLAALSETDAVKTAAAVRQRRLKLQTSYSQALWWSKGYNVEQTRAATAQAQELVAGVRGATERFAAYNAQWIGSFMRGELAQARETAETLLREAEENLRAPEAASASRSLGLVCFAQGEFSEAQTKLERALEIHDPNWDRETRFRFGPDVGPSASAYLALTKWQLGEANRARALIEEAVASGTQSDHAPSKAVAASILAMLDAIRGDAAAVLRTAEPLLQFSREHGLAHFLMAGEMYCFWARAWLGDRRAGAARMGEVLSAYVEQGVKAFLPFRLGLTAELEAEAGEPQAALERIDGALTLAAETGEHWSDAFLHRLRGEILLRRNPANTAEAEQAFLTSIAIAQQQQARSFKLRAALSLAKLYQSTGRPVEARAVLARALEGFAPTPGMPEIAEAQALMEHMA